MRLADGVLGQHAPAQAVGQLRVDERELWANRLVHEHGSAIRGGAVRPCRLRTPLPAAAAVAVALVVLLCTGVA